MNCKITFKTEEGYETADGEIVREGEKFRMLYRLGGDDCLLTYDSGRIIQTRRGGLSTDMEFKEGEITFCRICGEGTEGSVEIFTESVSVISGRGGVKIKLAYILADSKMSLEITAVCV